MRSVLSSVVAVILLARSAEARQNAPDTAITIKYGGFVDTYYAYDFARPPTFDRSFFGGATFTTQPARSNEFNVNLAFLEANLSGNRMHGRVAFQAGTSVQSNYAGEPANGFISGPLLARHIQEAYGGYQVGKKVWVDAGIFYSNMGMEGWVSRDNPTYTRSLVADYSPYYSSGVRTIWQATPTIALRLDVVNGWQNISETNIHKGAGMRIDYTPFSTTTVSYYNFFNGEVLGRTRVYNGIGVKSTTGRATLLAEMDLGTLDPTFHSDSASLWWGYTAVVRWRITSAVAIVGRYEGFYDRDQIVVVTGLVAPYEGPAASFGVDVVPQSRFMWRTEVRGFNARAKIFPNGTSVIPRRGDGFAVTSFSLLF
ncbi:MAG TPA: porin [Gemmatimonadaceae bacterium]